MINKNGFLVCHMLSLMMTYYFFMLVLMFLDIGGWAHHLNFNQLERVMHGFILT